MVNCFAYRLNSFTSLVLPQYEAIVSRWMSPLQFGEVVFMLWLVIMGAKPKPLADPGLNSATAASSPTGLGLKTEITRSPRQNHRRNNVTAAKLVGRSFGE